MPLVKKKKTFCWVFLRTLKPQNGRLVSFMISSFKKANLRGGFVPARAETGLPSNPSLRSSPKNGTPRANNFQPKGTETDALAQKHGSDTRRHTPAPGSPHVGVPQLRGAAGDVVGLVALEGQVRQPCGVVGAPEEEALLAGEDLSR